MKLITGKQIVLLHALLNKSGQLENKRQLVSDASNGRVTSSRELTSREANTLLNYLRSITVDPSDRLRGKVFSLAYKAGIIYGDTADDKKMNSAKLTRFILERGAVKKDLYKMSEQELLKTINQFAQIVKHSEESQHNKSVKILLTELNIKSILL